MAGATHEPSAKASTGRGTDSLGLGILPCHGGDRAGRPRNLDVGRTRHRPQSIVGPLVCSPCHCSCGSACYFSTSNKRHWRPLQGIHGGLADAQTSQALMPGATPLYPEGTTAASSLSRGISCKGCL